MPIECLIFAEDDDVPTEFEDMESASAFAVRLVTLVQCFDVVQASKSLIENGRLVTYGREAETVYGTDDLERFKAQLPELMENRFRFHWDAATNGLGPRQYPKGYAAYYAAHLAGVDAGEKIDVAGISITGRPRFPIPEGFDHDK